MLSRCCLDLCDLGGWLFIDRAARPVVVEGCAPATTIAREPYRYQHFWCERQRVVHVHALLKGFSTHLSLLLAVQRDHAVTILCDLAASVNVVRAHDLSLSYSVGLEDSDEIDVIIFCHL